MTPFSKSVIRLIKAIPRGNVSTYGQISKLAGKPHGARGVSWIIASCTKAYGLPWYRVVGGKGRISIPFGSNGFHRQKKYLAAEGVSVSDDGRIDLKLYGWKKRR